MPITELTEVQARCVIPAIEGRDVLAKSKTGSGKTLAFLIACVERIIRNGSPNPETSFPVVILSPVTDLATQIHGVTKNFLRYHPPMKADLVIGGTNERRDIERLTKDRIDILVATPGRFKSILNQSEVIRNRLASCQTFVIDEVDKLADSGFLHDTRFIKSIARESQTLAFSATMDSETLMKSNLLKKDAVVIAVDETNSKKGKIEQNVIVAPLESMFSALVHVVESQKMKYTSGQSGGNVGIDYLSPNTQKALHEWTSYTMTGYRIMVFLPSNAFIDYVTKAARIYWKDKLRIFSLHGGLAQHQRSKASDAFRKTDDCCLFTSDASARGVDYPDVTCVIQIGFDSRSEYIQRVGRTGRAGKSGEAFLIISPQEIEAASQVCNMIGSVIVDRKFLETERDIRFCRDVGLSEFDPAGIVLPKEMNQKDAKNAYRGWLGSLASKWKRLNMDSENVLRLAHEMADALRMNRMEDEKLRDKLHIKTKSRH